MSAYVQNFKDRNNKLMSLLIDDDKLLAKYKTTRTKLEYLKMVIKFTLILVV